MESLPPLKLNATASGLRTHTPAVSPPARRSSAGHAHRAREAPRAALPVQGDGALDAGDGLVKLVPEGLVLVPAERGVHVHVRGAIAAASSLQPLPARRRRGWVAGVPGWQWRGGGRCGLRARGSRPESWELTEEKKENRTPDSLSSTPFVAGRVCPILFFLCSFSSRAGLARARR